MKLIFWNILQAGRSLFSSPFWPCLSSIIPFISPTPSISFSAYDVLLRDTAVCVRMGWVVVSYESLKIQTPDNTVRLDVRCYRINFEKSKLYMSKGSNMIFDDQIVDYWKQSIYLSKYTWYFL